MVKFLRWQAGVAALLLVLLGGLSWWWSQQLSVNVRTVNEGNTTASAEAAQESRHIGHLADAERSLLTASQALVEGRLADAETMLAELIRQEPRFRLAHALLADVNRVRAGQLPATVDPSGAGPGWEPLLDEWRRRLRAPDHLPPPKSWPAGLVTFSPFSRHALVVDASTSRLYWLQRADDGSAPKLLASFYISVGKAGVGKEIEGDNKTPLGVYRITARRPSAELPAFYGAGALVLDYPNPVDRSLQRTGSGIWLHGSPPDTYTRDPLASEGCVVLSNTDMRQLMELPDVLQSPVLIVREIRWIDEAVHRHERDEALTLARDWMRTAVGLDPDPQTLGLQRWIEKDGHRYWRLEYRSPDPQQPRLTWFVREADDGLQHVAGPLQTARRMEESRTPDAAAGDKIGKGRDEPAAPPRTASSAAADGSKEAHEAILRTVQGWAKAWSARDVPKYLAHYHPRFQPEDGLTRQAWQAQRRQRIEDKRRIEVEVLQPRVRVDGQRASVTFIQRYRADGQRELRARKTLVLQREGSRWLIVEERTR